MQKAKVSDATSYIDVVWFNQPFLEEIIIPGKYIYLAAKLNPASNSLQISNPDYEQMKENTTHIARITPVYGLTDKIKQKWIRSKIKWLIEKLDYISDLEETLPEDIRNEHNLIDRKTAIKMIHFPDNQENIQKAKDRLAFEEMLELQIKLKIIRKKYETHKSYEIEQFADLKEKFLNSLPFKPTVDQSNATSFILDRLNRKKASRILLQGDVGCGKTLVAIEVALQVVANKKQVVYLAPTTILAEQIFQQFKIFLESFPKINISLLTSDKKIDSESECDIIIATHAILFQHNSLIQNTALLIVDEQHRFGVVQRNKILKDFEISKTIPHYLMMSATPIPRTIASVFFQDMDIYQITSKPLGRQDIETFLTPNSKKQDLIKWLKEEIKKDTQVYWVCPLINESQNLELENITKTYQELIKIFPEFDIAYLHGKMKEEEKINILEGFKNSKYQILVATTVIEVGIDTPNANIILIQSAERFGLAQLHQLRGRVGRRDKKGYCILFVTDENKISDNALKRLEYFCKTNDGMQVAQFDLLQRGPGEVYGIKQSGIPDLKIAKITDFELIQITSSVADKLLNINS